MPVDSTLTVSPTCTSLDVNSYLAWSVATTSKRSTALAGKFSIGIIPLSLVASTEVASMAMSAEPSKAVAVPVTAPVIEMFLGVSRVVAVPAFPVIVVCAGWTWSPRANLVVSVPTDALPATFGFV